MKILTGCLLIILLLAGCAPRADIPESQCLVYTTLNHHAITTWVNDEPILVCDNVYNGYNNPFWIALRKGENTVHLTASRLPATCTQAISEMRPGQQGDDTTVVKIIAGNIFHPKDLLEWKVTKDVETSPRWTVQSNKGYRPALERYEDVGPVNEEMLKEIAEFLERFRQALQDKDIAAVGWNVSDIEFLMKEAGGSCSVEKDIFGQEYYGAQVSPIGKLKVVCGKKTVMVYRPDGEKVFFAGRSPDAPNVDGMHYFLGWDALYFVKSSGKLEPLWVKDY